MGAIPAAHLGAAYSLPSWDTNYSNLEKQLLKKINNAETVHLALRNAFKHDDPGLTELLLELYQKSPSMFSGVLSRFDK
jgi:hypothetical protein